MGVEDAEVEGVAGAREGVGLLDVDGGYGGGDVEGDVDEGEDLGGSDVA